MSAAVFLDWATLIALGLLGLALFLSVIRIFIGPTLPDRVLALDLMTTVAIAFVGVISVRTGLMLYIDIAIALALLSFLATVALSRYLMLRTVPEAGKENG
jgi:multicomponent Na+:H+ antiporter subunit F